MYFNLQNIKLSDNRIDNFIKINNTDYQVLRINPNSSFSGSKGGNSNVFTLRLSEVNDPDKAIKICKTPLDSKITNQIKRLERFKREIEALKCCRDKNFIVKIFDDGITKIKDKNSIEKEFYFYTMEKGESDLKEYIIDNQFDIQTKILFCKQILMGMIELYELGIYHRDIKPDNILFVGDDWKICDLGLMSYQDEDLSIDDPNELIGPRGWLSPEAMNKHLTSGKSLNNNFDCKIDDKSDIFQLGKLFWFIFQSNVPIGRIHRDDFKLKNDDLYRLLIWMLNHSKQRRPNIYSLHNEMKPIFKKFAA